MPDRDPRRSGRHTDAVDRRADFDIRDASAPAAPRADIATRAAGGGRGRPRVNRASGTIRVLDRPAVALDPGVTRRRADFGALAGHLGLKPIDLAGLELVRDFTSRSTGIRHVLFRQTADGFPVFDSTVALHFQRERPAAAGDLERALLSQGGSPRRR